MLNDFVPHFWQNPRMTGVPEATSPETTSRRYPTFDPEDVDMVAAAVVAVDCSDGVHTEKECAVVAVASEAVAEKEAEKEAEKNAAVAAVVAEKNAAVVAVVTEKNAAVAAVVARE
jgi:hypothetical protein